MNILARYVLAAILVLFAVAIFAVAVPAQDLRWAIFAHITHTNGQTTHHEYDPESKVNRWDTKDACEAARHGEEHARDFVALQYIVLMNLGPDVLETVKSTCEPAGKPEPVGLPI